MFTTERARCGAGFFLPTRAAGVLFLVAVAGESDGSKGRRHLSHPLDYATTALGVLSQNMPLFVQRLPSPAPDPRTPTVLVVSLDAYLLFVFFVVYGREQGGFKTTDSVPVPAPPSLAGGLKVMSGILQRFFPYYVNIFSPMIVRGTTYGYGGSCLTAK